MAIENSVFNDFLFMFLDSIVVLDCRLPGVINVIHGIDVVLGPIIQCINVYIEHFEMTWEPLQHHNA